MAIGQAHKLTPNCCSRSIVGKKYVKFLLTMSAARCSIIDIIKYSIEVVH